MSRPSLRLASLLLVCLTLACAPRKPNGRSQLATVERSRYLMGTLCNLLVQAADTARASSATASALDEIARLESVMSSWRKDSELSALNLAAGRPHECSPDLFQVLELSRSFAEATEGAFDPTVDPLIRAWDLRGAGRVPSALALAAARARVGWPHLHLDRERRTATLDVGAAIDLGGIGKGYALDRAAEKLREAGADRALLDFGGEVLAMNSADADRDAVDTGWEVPIASPANRLQPIVSVTVRDRAVSTSAQSERGFDVAGERYGHVLDPRTGVPVESRASVTVVASSATSADAMSTALLVQGREAAAQWAARHPEDGVIWLDPAGSSVRMWSWNVEPRSLAGAPHVIRMDSTAVGRAPPP